MTPITLVALGVAVVAIAAAVFYAQRARGAATERDAAKARAAELSKYTVIEDAEAHAARLQADAATTAARIQLEAKANADRLTFEASSTLSAAKIQAEAGVEAAKAAARETRAKAEEQMAVARREAALIVAQAQQRGQEIAGEALEAKGKADEYTRITEAMKNVIEGYGDKYIIPTFSLLDDLAEEFGFAEGGKKLK